MNRLELAALSLLLAIAPLARAERRAFVVGNDGTAAKPLATPSADARDLGRLLEGAGWKVTVVTRAPARTLAKAVGAYERQLRPGDTSLVFFAGYGITAEREAVLLPDDATARTPTKELAPFRLSAWIRRIHDRGVRSAVFLVDAQRELDGTGLASEAPGIPEPELPDGTLVASASPPGVPLVERVEGGHGLWTQKLLGTLAEPGVEIEEALEKVAADVARASAGAEQPFARARRLPVTCIATRCERPPPPGLSSPELRQGHPFVLLPATTIEAGCPPRGRCANPVKTRVEALWLGEAEVTVADYRRCVVARACPAPPRGFDVPEHTCHWPKAVDVSTMDCLPHDAAEAYCRFVGGRLPSGVELERAAQSELAGSRNEWNWTSARSGAHGFEIRAGASGAPATSSWRSETAREAGLGFRCARDVER